MCRLYHTMHRVLLVSLFIIATVHSDPVLVENGYENVIVEIEDSVPEHMCSSVFQGLEEMLTRGSSVMYRATNQKAFFRHIIIVVPFSWSGTHCPALLTTAAPPSSQPSIVVGAPHPVFMHTPWTLQEKGCGQPGKRIYMTPEFLAMRNHSTSLGDPGRLLVHEWAKYRWGVFEEYGHESDPIYPPYQRVDPHSYVPTGCSNVKVEGMPETCNPQHKKCHFVPNLNHNDGVTSSLMYLHYLPRVTQFCDGHTHQSHTPTKQNILCNRRSVWDVMRQHEDFLNSTSANGEETRDVTPTFKYVRPAPRRYVIVIEDTTIMNVQKRWDFLRKAIRKLLVYDLPAGHEVGVVLFDQIGYFKLPLTPTPSALEARQRLATASLPRNPSQVAPSQKCIVCGLEEAVRILQEGSGSSAGGVIFLITSGSPLPLSEYDIRKMEQVVTRGEIQLVPIMYPVTTRNPQPTPGVENLAQISETRSFAVLDEGIGSDSKVSMMVSLMNSIYSALRLFLPSASQLPILVHQQEFPGGISSTSEGSFDLDETLGGKVRFCLTYYDLGHVGNTINLIDPEGNVLDSSNLQEEDGDVNMIFVTIRNAMPGRWSYKIENRADSHQSLFIQVLSTPSDRNGSFSGASSNVFSSSSSGPSPAVTLEAWTSSKTTFLNVSDASSPVAIYAKVWAGRSPVVGARVEVKLRRLGFNSTGSHFRPLRFLLFDNGNGDADLTKGDGIYSRYLPVLDDTPARYSLSVEASDDGGKAAIVAPALPDQHPWSNHGDIYVSPRARNRERRALAYGMSGPNCCGSIIQYSRTIDSGHLSRSETIGILDIVSERAVLGIVPPSKVGDFKVTVNMAALHATFSWTAPGDQRDHGRASRYEVVFSREASAVMSGNGENIEQWPTPQVGGHPSQHTVRWNRHDGLYYVALRAVSRSGKTGPWSNLASVYVPPPATTTEINTRGSTFAGTTGETIGELSPPAHSRSLLSNKDILAIVGAACGLLLIILVLAIYYMIVLSRRRQQKEKKVKEVIDASNCNPTTPEHEDETDSINKQPPESIATGEIPSGVQRPLSPIQSWPASTLLAEHERRRSADPCFGEAPDLGVPYHQPHPFYYHTPNGHYIEDTIPIDSGSMISTQPSESLLVYKMDTSATESVHPSTSPLGTTPISWEGPNPSTKRSKVPPPILPKPSISTPPVDLCSSSATLGHERRRRNVTQV